MKELTYSIPRSSLLQGPPAVAEDGGHDVDSNQDSCHEDPKGSRVSAIML